MWKLHCQDLTLFSIIPCTPYMVHLWVTHLLLLDTKFGKGGLYETFNTTQDKKRTAQVDTSDRLTTSNLETTICSAAEECFWATAPVYNLHTWFPSICLRNTICRSFRMALQSLWGKGGGIKGFGFQFVLSGVSSTSLQTWGGWYCPRRPELTLFSRSL